MAIHRMFLGWDKPVLSEAVTWLWACDRLRAQAISDRGGWDLGGVLLVLPGGRAMRRIREMLVMKAEAEGALLIPPRITTVGDLPEQLYEAEEPGASPASELVMALTWARVLREAEGSLRSRVLPVVPADDDVAGWLGLADELMGVVRDLAAAGLTPGDVPQRMANVPDFPEEERWRALAALTRQVEATLSYAGWLDRDAARRQALESGRCRCDGEVVLLATSDIPTVTAAMLRQLTTPVTALIAAPADELEAFDDLGLLRTEAWVSRKIDLAEDRIRFVINPREQSHEVVRALEADGGGYATDQITIGLGDESQATAVRRTLELCGVPSRVPAAGTMDQAPPALLLTRLARFAATRRLDDLAALLRHPDLEAGLDESIDAEPWQTLLDRYATAHLQGRLSGTWLGDEATAGRLKAAHDAVVALLPSAREERRPLPAWAEPFATAIAAVYRDRILQRGEAADDPLIQSLAAMGDALRDIRGLDEQDSSVPHVTAAEAAAIVERMLQLIPIHPPGGEAAIELLGWLELPLDDAPLLVVTGMNEGHIPASRNSDAWLPDHVRRALQLTDNARRLARDTHALSVIMRTRPQTTLIACRRTAEGDPLSPSRLLLACDEATLARRVSRFYDDRTGGSDAGDPLLLLGDAAASSGFLIPAPEPPTPPVSRLRVTAFRDYLACPYRFYLKHVRRLGSLDDRAVELDALAFGTLAHEVLQAFGRGPLAGSTRADEIRDELHASLAGLLTRRYGSQPPPAVLIQSAQLRERLAHFAQWQADQAAAGWCIVGEHIERELAAAFAVDDAPFILTGRIDRIDRHAALGYRLLDYKTGDSGDPPDRTHRRGNEWIDLQLPLYRRLAASVGVTEPIELGYVILPKNLDAPSLSPALWDAEELAEAEATAADVIRKLREGVFWPPGEPVDDELAAICMDRSLQRQERIDATTARMREGGRP